MIGSVIRVETSALAPAGDPLSAYITAKLLARWNQQSNGCSWTMLTLRKDRSDVAQLTISARKKRSRLAVFGTQSRRKMACRE